MMMLMKMMVMMMVMRMMMKMMMMMWMFGMETAAPEEWLRRRRSQRRRSRRQRYRRKLGYQEGVVGQGDANSHGDELRI